MKLNKNYYFAVYGEGMKYHIKEKGYFKTLCNLGFLSSTGEIPQDEDICKNCLRKYKRREVRGECDASA